MARDPDVPEVFDVHTLVLLRRAEDPPSMSEGDLDALQSAHLAYRAELAREGTLVANGPFRMQSDDRLRGLSVFACSPEEAARLSDDDPSVRAGRLAYEVMEWWVRAGTLDFPRAGGPVGRRRGVDELD